MQVKTHSKENTIPYVSTFNPYNAEMFGICTNNLHILYSDDKMKDALNGTKLIKSEIQPPNLKKLLTRTKLTENSTAQRKVTNCGHPYCSLCLYMPNGSSYNFDRKVFQVNADMICDVGLRNVIYVITCNGCREYYIGQTVDKLRTRRTIHAQQKRDHTTRQIPLSQHLDLSSEDKLKFKIFLFCKVNSENISVRLGKGKCFISCFKPKLNHLRRDV